MTAHHARDAAYDIVLIAHVLSALAALGVVAVAGACAVALLRRGQPSSALHRYYRPGINWAGRLLFAVPVLGGVLVAMSGGDWSWSDGWVLGGLLLWLAAAAVAEVLLWPGERALQAAVVSASWSAADQQRRCLSVAASAGAVAALIVIAAIIMVAKP